MQICARLAAGQPEVCHEQVKMENAQLKDCTDQAALAKWKGESPLYHGDQWQVARVKCVIGGQYRPKRDI